MLTVLVSLQTAVSGRHGFEIRRIFAAWTGARYKNSAQRVLKCAHAFKLVFGCFYVFDITNTEIHTWKEYSNIYLILDYFVALTSFI